MPTSQSSFPAKRSRKKEASQEENFGSHLQPQAPELEAAVLGSIMVEHDAFAEVCDIITSEETFYEPRNQKVYAAIMRLYTNDHPIDMLSVTEELRRHGELEQVGGPYYIAKLCDTVSGSFNVEYYAAIIQQKYIFRQIISYSSRLQTQAFDETTELKQLIEDAEAGLFSITQFSRKKDYTQIDPVVQEAYKMVHDAAIRIEGFPKKLESELKHCILAHHGEYEYGSPKKPALAEAMALNLADNTDAKMETMKEVLDNAGDETGWLGYNRLFESNLRKTSLY